MTGKEPFFAVGDGVRVALKIVPRAGRTGVCGVVTDAKGKERLKLRVAAAPVEGQANEAVTKLLAKALRIPARSIAIVAGAHDRDKVVHIRGEAKALMESLKSWVEGHT